ncbi:alanine racemase [Lentzea sp. E54]|uniref:alanine racemase n=1 Tax=Lentzea xerophila TaxID=3435883 RepID=UPI003DA3FB29
MSSLAVDVQQTHAGPVLHVDLTAVAANTRHFVEATPAAVMAVVKASGFGHGLPALATTALASGATWIGVTSIEEAVEVRGAGVRAPVLSWLNPVDVDTLAVRRYDIDLSVPSVHHLAAIEESAGPPIRIHLQLDTGMARDGAAPEEWFALMSAAKRAEVAKRVKVVGVMGHLPMTDSHSAGLRAFERGVQMARQSGLRPAFRHLASTSATLTDRRTHMDMVRIGAGLVGIDPSGTTNLRGGLTLTAPVVQVRRVRKGTGVGYGHTYVTSRSTTLALVPLGYADGVPRLASGRAEVWLAGRRRPVVGLVSMDQIVVDMGDDPLVPGAQATVFGPGDNGEPTVEDWAQWAGTIPHEIMTGIGPRVRRVVR